MLEIMNKLKSGTQLTSFLLVALMAVSLVLPAIGGRAFASTPNLVPNADLSQLDTNSQPLSWHTDNWGTNSPSFSFSSGSQVTSAYLRVDMQNYQDGDAKWWFNPVNVSAGDTYQFTDAYISNTISSVWARFLDSSNNPSYQWLGNDSVSSSLKQASFNFIAPANNVSVTIFHVLNSNGYLETNNFSLYDVTPPICQLTMSNGIYNSSLEDTCNGDTTIPAGWSHAVYGSATASFDYLNSGFTGSHSIDINLTSAGGGEGGWYFKPVPVSANQRYKFSFWYSSTIYAYAYAEINLSNGQVAYQSLMSVPASGLVWSQYQDEFITPANAQSLTVHIATSDVGKVILDDFALAQLPNYASNSFSRPVISIDFDDGWRSGYTNGLPLLNQMGFKATFFINGGVLGSSGYMTTAQVKSLATADEEIGSHSYYHDDLVTLPLSAAQDEISRNYTYLQNLTGQNIYDFATPYGSYNTPVLDYIMQFHQTQRDTSGKLNYKYNFNSQTIHSILITKETTVAKISNLIQQAKTNGAWLIFTYHGIASGGDDYTITKATLQKQLQAIKKSGVAVETTHQAYTEIQSQL